MAVGETQEFKYAAFISYRHLPRDKAIAQKVQRAIEGFKLPKNVRRKDEPNPFGLPSNTETTRTLGRCFRDEDELAASHSLPEHIRQALDQSRTLIVICTPDTNDSPWVRREIEEFLRLHGRQRIIAVLANGSSSESIPAILKSKHIVSADGTLVAEPTEPLAADLRPESAREHGAEMLRVIAAVAGCGYDDLRQRQRRRQRRRVALGAAGALAIASIIAALVAWGLSPSAEQLTAESRDLAARSHQQLAQGDRMTAIETALAALPASSTDTSRPLVPEAQTALEDAVQLYPAPSEGTWRPSFLLRTPGEVASFATSITGTWIAILDDSRTVSVFDLLTGTPRFSIDLTHYEGDAEQPTRSIANEWAMAAAGPDKLLIVNRSGDGNLVCFDAVSGEALWQEESIPVSSFAISEDGDQIALFTIFEGESLLAGLIDTTTGEAIDWVEMESEALIDYPSFLPSFLNDETNRAYLGMGGLILNADFQTGTIDGIKATDHMILSLNGESDIIVAAATDRADDSYGQNQPYSVVCAQNRELLWSNTGTYDDYFANTQPQPSVLAPFPKVKQIITYNGERAAVAAVGNSLKVVRLSDGIEMYSKDLSAACVGANASWLGDDRSLLFTASADGILSVSSPDDAPSNSSLLRTVLPCPVDEVSFEWHGDAFLALAKCAAPTDYLMVYHFDSRPADETAAVSLDVLIAEAHELLSVYAGNGGHTSIVHNPHEYTYTGLPNGS
ncbi:toll/interleukin-1 receptor domain-containing protein [Adlercreutzia murintestinalis]|uniref:toll/interleukin-1 receptor domain-containing protein n=1 Tax=Adlercreutzia murintestinalis TaxID=2941325 RepID=UPI00203B0044|nr:toll/interleukin-1 receptor domain-containing protein [Adlercreutzia murintestinalis]